MTCSRLSFTGAALIFAATAFSADEPRKPADPPAGVQIVSVRNSIDGTAEPVWFLPNPSAEPAPLRSLSICLMGSTSTWELIVISHSRVVQRK